MRPAAPQGRDRGRSVRGLRMPRGRVRHRRGGREHPAHLRPVPHPGDAPDGSIPGSQIRRAAGERAVPAATTRHRPTRALRGRDRAAHRHRTQRRGARRVFAQARREAGRPRGRRVLRAGSRVFWRDAARVRGVHRRDGAHRHLTATRLRARG